MRLHELKPAEGSHCVGRGTSSGNETSGRSKRSKSRSGGGVRLGLKVTNPLFRRLPKRDRH